MNRHAYAADLNIFDNAEIDNITTESGILHSLQDFEQLLRCWHNNALSFRLFLAESRVLLTQGAQVFKRINAGLVSIRPPRTERVVPHRTDTFELGIIDRNKVTAPAVALTHRARTPAAQIGKGILAEQIIIP